MNVAMPSLLRMGLCIVLIGTMGVLGNRKEEVMAQTLTYRGEVGMTAASTTGQPLWIRAKEYGGIDPESANGYVRLGGTGRTDTSRIWDARVGVGLLGRVSETETVHFSELYAQFRYAFLQLRAGRRPETIGPIQGGDLSSGSLIQSQNATPPPIIALETPGYIEAPFTKGLVEVKGQYAHGWFDDGRFVDDTYLHRKTAYLRVGHGRTVSATMGLVHNAQWGGTSPADGPLPRDFRDYLRVVIGTRGPENAPEGERINAIGNHIGIFDFGGTVQWDRFALNGYHQHLFEDGSSFDEWKNFPDGLYGLRWTDAHQAAINVIQYEFLYTKKQSGPIRPPGRDDYYNNFIYRSGWSSNRSLLGSPLFLFDPSRPSGESVVSNRIVAHHVGVSGHPFPPLRYRAMATWMRHSGTYDHPFSEPQTQMAFLFGLRATPFEEQPLDVGGAVAVDTGDIFEDRVGLRLSLTYRGQR